MHKYALECSQPARAQKMLVGLDMPHVRRECQQDALEVALLCAELGWLPGEAGGPSPGLLLVRTVGCRDLAVKTTDLAGQQQAQALPTLGFQLPGPEKGPSAESNPPSEQAWNGKAPQVHAHLGDSTEATALGWRWLSQYSACLGNMGT